MSERRGWETVEVKDIREKRLH